MAQGFSGLCKVGLALQRRKGEACKVVFVFWPEAPQRG
jgi:hypothetical protein